MTENAFESFRLSLMQEVLPVGVALVNRARQKGAQAVLEVLTSSNKPFEELRSEGEPTARILRDKLDQLSLGLGNPVMSVKVDVEDTRSDENNTLDTDILIEILNKIDERIQLLDGYLNNDVTHSE